MKKQLLLVFFILFSFFTIASAAEVDSVFPKENSTPPINDECSGAINLTVNPTLEAISFVSGTTAGATLTQAPLPQTCSEDQQYANANDVWYSFTATATKHFVNFSSITEEQRWTILYNVYSGSECDNLSFVLCRYVGSDPNPALENLTIGTTYKIRVRFAASENSNSNTFDISVTTPPLPLNDECNGAIPVAVNPTMQIESFVSGSNLQATYSNITGGCSYQNALDVWYSFVATSSKQLIYFNNIVSNGTYHYLQFQIFSGADCATHTPVICHYGEGHVINDLVAGQTYKIMVFSLPYNALSFDLSIHNAEPVTNDECTTATNIPVNEGSSTEFFTTAYDLGCTVSDLTIGCQEYKDTWYSFIATNSTQIVRFYDLNDNQIFKSFSLYTGEDCNNLSMINCESDGILKNLSIGSTYKIRLIKNTVDSPFNEAFRIRINSIDQLLNDECQSAITLTVNPNLEKVFFAAGSTVLATPSIPSQNDSRDIWYRFVATSTQHLIYTDNSVGSFYVTVFPENNCEMPQEPEYIGQVGHLKNLVIGNAYTIRVDSNSSYTDYSAVFDISIMTIENVPNDECSNAIDVPVNETVDCELFATGMTQGATPSEFEDYTSGNDTWFSFVATSKTHVIKFHDLDNVLFNVFFYYGLYSSDNCSGSNLIGSGNKGSAHNNLIIGNTYKIRLFSQNDVAPFAGNVKVCITTPPQPVNDECSNATVVPVNTSEESEIFVSSTTLGATASGQPNGCQGNADDDVWFSFVATSKFHYIRLDNIVGISNNLKIMVYQGLDCGTMIQLPCINFPLATLNTLTIGENYIVRVFSDSDNANAFASFDISILTPALAINDECSNPIQLTVLEEFTDLPLPQSIIYHATNSPQENTCLAGGDDDVWYEFVATSERHSINFWSIHSNIYTTLSYAIYTGDCNNLIQLYCNDANYSILENLTIGQAYKIRVWSAINTPTYVSYYLFISHAPLVPNTSQFTNEQLVTNVLVNNPCVEISNISSNTGSDHGSVNGIGYFTNTNPAFPLSSGLILSTGNANNVGGPNLTNLNDGNSSAWTNVGDTDLESIILSATGQTMVSRNATKLEFDFTSQNEFMSFNFLFASEEYGTFQCQFADAFAFLLTDLVTGVTKNLAVVPGTNVPISVVTIRDNEHNPNCNSQNQSFFDKFNSEWAHIAPINFNGQTTLMSASSEIIANRPYHIKLVIADRQDPMYDSAVFIQAGSFSSGPPQCTDKVQLVAFIDENNNGTKEDTENSFTYGSFVYQVNDGGENTNISSPIGNYSIYDSNPSNSYDFSYEVHPEYAAYFTAGAVSHSDISIATGSGTQTLYFPITQIQGYNDVTVSIVPTGQPTAGFSHANKIVYKNLGTAAASGTITYSKDPSVTVASNVVGLTSTPDGFTYSFINLAPFETRSFNFTINVPSIPVVNIDDVFTSSVSIAAPADDINMENNSFVNSQIVVASYDPNDKMEAHGEKLDFTTFNQDDYLFYTIRFQNTGTANAINIRIEDVLDAKLDEESIRMVSASHNYVMERVGSKLVWKFDYIYLPSMLANEELSNGYLTFMIKVKPGFALGDVIPNFAEIYFDTNPAIITNTFTSTFEEQLATPEFSAGNINIYPNPSNGLVYISVQNTNENLAAIKMYDVLGKTVLSSRSFSSKQSAIDVSAFAKGVYMIEITTENNLRQIKKLVVN